jgi:hypothetical protein
LSAVAEATSEEAAAAVAGGSSFSSSSSSTTSSSTSHYPTGEALRRVFEAGREATRRVDGEELRIKGEELRIKSENARTEAENVLDLLSSIRYERLRLVIMSSSSIEFGSDDAHYFLDGLTSSATTTTTTPPSDRVALMQSMITFGHPVGPDIESFAHAESERDARVRDRDEVGRTLNARRRALVDAEEDVRFAMVVRNLYILCTMYHTGRRLCPPPHNESAFALAT